MGIRWAFGGHLVVIRLLIPLQLFPGLDAEMYPELGEGCRREAGFGWKLMAD